MQQLALTDAFPDERPVLGNCQHCGQPVREGDAHKASAALDFDPIGQVYVSKVRYWHISKLSEDPDRERDCSHLAWKEDMAKIQAENDRLRKEKETAHAAQA